MGYKLPPDAIKEIERRLQRGESTRPIATDYGVSQTTIWNIKHGRYSLDWHKPGPQITKERIHVKERDFTGLSIEEINDLIQRDIRSLARAWRKKNPTSRNFRVAATACAATYLSKHHSLYFRDDTQAMKAAHHAWMLLMQEWFISAIK